MLTFPLAILIVASIFDVRSREIPDWIPLLMIVSAVVAVTFDWIPLSFAQSLLGVGVGFLITLPLAWMGGLGGGDLKLVSALGAWFGPIALVCVLFWVAIAGLVLSAAFWVRGKKDLPYVPAIAIGLAIFLCWPQGILVLLKSLTTR
ncbi:MAG: prepilin peptidase [Planctomycetaceae bacterium]|nr:prepilin peptidase [Planctomycetaceae bacterium]